MCNLLSIFIDLILFRQRVMVSFGKGTFIFHKMQDKTKENLQSYGQTELSLGNCR
mgnify:CR=1 FL=1